MLEYIYICRHGFRSNWVDPNIKTGPTGMNRDPPLAAYGEEQADRLASFLSTPETLAPHPVPERVFSSPFYRCIQTAIPTSAALGPTSACGEETGQDKGKGKGKGKGKSNGVALEHGVQEWYSPVVPDSGLHPRPGHAPTLAVHFPSESLDEIYTSTLYPSRRGEKLRELQDRADLFVEAWTARCEEMGLRSVVVFAHAASVIALGRALTGDKSLDVSAGCASCSLYRRKHQPPPSPAHTRGHAHARPAVSAAVDGSSSHVAACGVGEWEPVWLGRADYLKNGVERDWSFRDVVLRDGEVIEDNGDHDPHPPQDEIPAGLAPGMERHLRRGFPAPNVFVLETGQPKGRM